MRTARNVARLVLLPGRVVIRWIDGRKAVNGVGPLNTFQRGAVHAFLGVVGLVLLVNFTVPTNTEVRSTSTDAARSSTAHTAPDNKRDRPVPQPASVSQNVHVTRVIDGDTFELGDGRTVRVLGIDSCETDTPGGTDAKAAAQVRLEFTSAIVTMTAEPTAPDVDRDGRLLRYVQVSGADYGVDMVRHDHTGVYNPDNNDDGPAYLERLYAADLDYAANPPAGRECGSYPPPVAVDHDSDGSVYVPLPDDDDDGESRFCRKRWWC